MTKVEFLMSTLKISKEEAEQLVADDAKIDKMQTIKELNSDLTKEQTQTVKKMRSVGQRIATTQKREKKVNNEKKALIDLFTKALDGKGENLEIINDEREFTFFYNDVKYKIVLSAPRK